MVKSYMEQIKVWSDLMVCVMEFICVLSCKISSLSISFSFIFKYSI